jgi:hypothetical protein
MGLEPTSSAWKAEVLAFELHPQTLQTIMKNHFTTPLILQIESLQPHKLQPQTMVEGGGFEPPKAEPADLQSAPFDRSGTPPHQTSTQTTVFTQQIKTINAHEI